MRETKWKPVGAEELVLRLNEAWQSQPTGERQFVGVTANRCGGTITFGWANYLTGAGGLLSRVGETQSTEATLTLLAELGRLRETCWRGSLLSREIIKALAERPQLDASPCDGPAPKKPKRRAQSRQTIGYANRAKGASA